MYTKEQIEIALKEYERLGSVQAVINLLNIHQVVPCTDGMKEKLQKKQIIVVRLINHI